MAANFRTESYKTNWGNTGGLEVSIHGIDDLKRELSALSADLRRKVILSALRKAARVPLREARRVVPVMSSSEAAKNPFRSSGLLKKRLGIRLSKEAKRQGNLGVFVNVRPARGAKWGRTTTTNFLGIKNTEYTLKRKSDRGARNPNDPFYWRFVEFGTVKMPERPFLREAGATLPQALEVFKAEVIPQIEKYNRKK